MKSFLLSKKAKIITISITFIVAAGLAVFFMMPDLFKQANAVPTTPAVTTIPTMEVTATPTMKPTPRLPYIPDPLELQTIPPVASLNCTENYIESELTGSLLKIKWPMDANADYYVLCVLDENNNILQKDILHADIGAWELDDFAGFSILLISYKDYGRRRGPGMTVLWAYISHWV